MYDGNHHAHLLRRFWQSASGFWTGRTAWCARLLSALLLVIVIAQLLAQYWLNYWNRDFFNALEARNKAALLEESFLFFPLAALSLALAVASVWGRMTTQRLWRRHLTIHCVEKWLADNRYRSLGHLNSEINPQNPEYRIAEDARVATDAPVDLTMALCSSILTATVFFGILANVGGSIALEAAGVSMTIPAYLAISVLVYSGVITVAVLLIGRRYTAVAQDEVQAEAEFRAIANLIRESGEGIVVTDAAVQVRELWARLNNVIEQWRRVCWQHVRITIVSHGNLLLAPVVGLLLCVPKYLSGDMSLGEVTQAGAAFMTVQSAINWLVDNFQRMADWRAAANRVATLLLALDDLERGERPARPSQTMQERVEELAPRA